MDFSKLINDFVEGGIDQAGEEQLFASLAADKSLRRELQQQIEIERVALSDVDAYMPHPNTTAAIFQRLNIDGAAAIVPTFVSKLLELWIRFRGNALSAVVAASITALIFYLLQPFGNSDMNSEINYAENPSNSSTIARSTQQEIPQVSASAVAIDNNDKTSSVGIGSSDGNIARRPLTPKVMNSQANNSHQETDTRLSDNLQEKESQSDLSDAQSREPLVALLESNVTAIEITGSPLAIEDKMMGQPVEMQMKHGVNLLAANKLSIELKGSEYWSFPVAGVDRSTSPFLENTGFTLLYHATDDLMVGFDMRQEFFYYEYKDDINYYKQHTNFMAYGLTAKYNFWEFYGIKAQSGLYLGANEVGVIGRASIGIEYSPSYYYGFVMGVEGSNILYEHKGEPFDSKKLGFYYGIRFKL
jgi:hypothetical protein